MHLSIYVKTGLTGCTCSDTHLLFQGDNVATHLSDLFDGVSQTDSVSANIEVSIHLSLYPFLTFFNILFISFLHLRLLKHCQPMEDTLLRNRFLLWWVNRIQCVICSVYLYHFFCRLCHHVPFNERLYSMIGCHR